MAFRGEHDVDEQQGPSHRPDATGVGADPAGYLGDVRGHIAGIERMMNEDQPCPDLLVQIAAVRSSIDKIGFFLLESNAINCLCESFPVLYRK